MYSVFDEKHVLLSMTSHSKNTNKVTIKVGITVKPE